MISNAANMMQTQGTALSDVLLEDNFLDGNQVVEDSIAANTCVTLMRQNKVQTISIICGSEILYYADKDTEDFDVTNTAPIPLDTYFSSKDTSKFSEAYEKDTMVTYERNGKLYCILPVAHAEDEVSRQDACFLVQTMSLRTVLADYNRIEEWVFLVDFILFVLLILVAVFYTASVIKPFRQLISYIGRITEGFLDEKVSLKSYKEIEDVVDSINSMTTKLETLESSRQEFVSNVSHELKTPITSIKVLADSLLQQTDAPAELYREFLVDINAEIERENKIITDLLSLVKMDKTAGELNISTININELCEQILKRIKPIAAERNIELVFESYRPVMAEVDEVKLSLAVNNLIENAVKYNFDNGWVRVSLNADHKFFYIKVADSGVGIPEDEQENVFERFYRVDKARSRETGGTGLGLSITRNAILMHRGAIKVYSKEKEGTTFTVRIPLNYTN